MSDTAVATIVVSAPSTPVVTVTPPTAALVEGTTVQFAASGPVTWSVQEGDAGGTITPDGLYTAPATPGTYHVVATAVVVPVLGTIGATVGATQSATVGASFAPLQAQVLDSTGAPVVGASVTFLAPTTGASGLFSGAASVTATTDATGTATATITANATVGAFSVLASSPAAMGTATFSLSNTAAATQAPGFTNVTPAGANTSPLVNGNFGFTSVDAHPGRASDVYASLDLSGVWKSTDFGRTFHGPINTGANGSVLASGAGSLALARSGPSDVPILYANNLRGSSQGIWKSINGGVDWSHCAALPTSQDVYPPVIDPHDANHLLVPYHEQNLLAESSDGGASWRNVPLNPAMNMSGGSGGIWFVETGDSATTRTTWLWQAQGASGSIGIWRTTDSGATWVQVQTFEKPHGPGQLWQRGNGEIVYGGPYGSANFASLKDKNTWGTFRSLDYGQTWARVDTGQNSSFIATALRLYSQFSWSAGVFEPANPNCRVALLTNTAAWSSIATPPVTGSWTAHPPVPETGMTNGWAGAVSFFDGTNWVIVGAHKNGGLWRYVEAA